MSKHTPGPWVSSKFGFQVLTGDSWNTICELKGPAEWEDKRGSYDQEFEGQIQQANARLIASAPDLLEALRPFCAAYEAYVSTTKGFVVEGVTSAERRFSEVERRETAEEAAFEALASITFDHLSAVSAAIAKAEGGAL